MLTSSQSNILVDTAGHARITDFGLAAVTHDLDSIRNAAGLTTATHDLDSNASDEHGHNARWIAPEILSGWGTYGKEADVYSFAMVTIEVRCRYLSRDRHLVNRYSP